MQTQLLTRSAQLLDTVSGYDQVLVITHDNPDPDAIASGWSLKWLVERKLGIPTRLIGGGGIVRAENRQMVKLLDAPIELVQDYYHVDQTAAILVDCGYGASNHLLADTGLRPVGVVDHHQCGRATGAASLQGPAQTRRGDRDHCRQLPPRAAPRAASGVGHGIALRDPHGDQRRRDVAQPAGSVGYFLVDALCRSHPARRDRERTPAAGLLRRRGTGSAKCLHLRRCGPVFSAAGGRCGIGR